MNILVVRYELTDKYTLGAMFLNSKWFGYTLEDVVRPDGVKVQDQTAIPYGTYDVILDMSAHFGKIMPHILNVPMFDGVRIHGGNTPADTEGCILVCSNYLGNGVIQGSLSDAFIHQLQQNAQPHKIKVTTALDHF